MLLSAEDRDRPPQHDLLDLALAAAQLDYGHALPGQELPIGIAACSAGDDRHTAALAAADPRVMSDWYTAPVQTSALEHGFS